MKASWAPGLLKALGGGRVWPQLYIFFVHSILKAKASTRQSRRKHTVWLQGAGGTCSSATITAPFCLPHCSPNCTTFLFFCNPLLCFPPPPLKAYVSSSPLFCSSAFCFSSLPFCYLSLNQPGCFTSDRNILCSSSSWEGRVEGFKAESPSLIKRLMGGTNFSEGLTKRRGRIHLGLAQRVCPDLGQTFATKDQPLQKDWVYVHYDGEAEMLAVMKTVKLFTGHWLAFSS